MKPGARRRRGAVAYLVLTLLVLGSALAGQVFGWTAFGRQIDQYAYDLLFRLEQPAVWEPSSIILALDEATLTRYGGISGMRAALADGLGRIQPAHPVAVAVDLILPEPGAADDRLEEAFARTKNLVLSCDMQPDGSRWEDPIPRFRKYAEGVGEVHSDPDGDAVSRGLPLEMAVSRDQDRRWALSLQTLIAIKHGGVVESPEDLTVGTIRIPSRFDEGRVIRIRYAPRAMKGIPRVSIAALDDHPALAARFSGKVVFAGVTAQTAVRDRWMTPDSDGVPMPGIEMHANAYETLAREMFLVDARRTAVLGSCMALAACASLAYTFAEGWMANLLTVLVLLGSQLLPAIAFRHSVVWPWVPGTLAVVIASAAGAAWAHLQVRRELAGAEDEKTRYQRTMQFVTHEMRTPLTAIQGSSELISRYGSMPEAKRKQIAEMINAESRRLARMISTFLSIERLSDGEVAMKDERFALAELVDTCVERARHPAENKQIEIEVGYIPDTDLTGDRELLEYAVYNLLTNAVKYSPPQTRVTVFGEDDKGGRVRLSVRDQGIGMEQKEVGRIFDKFYRTKKAELSGEAGTGIGLSIVEKIVTEHGGAIQVASEPGKGSTFTLILRRAA